MSSQPAIYSRCSCPNDKHERNVFCWLLLLLQLCCSQNVTCDEFMRTTKDAKAAPRRASMYHARSLVARKRAEKSISKCLDFVFFLSLSVSCVLVSLCAKHSGHNHCWTGRATPTGTTGELIIERVCVCMSARLAKPAKPTKKHKKSRTHKPKPAPLALPARRTSHVIIFGMACVRVRMYAHEWCICAANRTGIAPMCVCVCVFLKIKCVR